MFFRYFVCQNFFAQLHRRHRVLTASHGRHPAASPKFNKISLLLAAVRSKLFLQDLLLAEGRVVRIQVVPRNRLLRAARVDIVEQDA